MSISYYISIIKYIYIDYYIIVICMFINGIICLLYMLYKWYVLNAYLLMLVIYIYTYIDY